MFIIIFIFRYFNSILTKYWLNMITFFRCFIFFIIQTNMIKCHNNKVNNFFNDKYCTNKCFMKCKTL